LVAANFGLRDDWCTAANCWAVRRTKSAKLVAGDLNQIVARTGYASPYAFAAAFRRHHGDPPGRRRQFQKAPKAERRH
jgi:AraC-like DNA-binding protein